MPVGPEVLVVDRVKLELDLAAPPAEEAVVVGAALEAVHAAELLQAPVVSLLVLEDCDVILQSKESCKN